MKDLNEIFSTVGFELSNIQLNEIFMEMEAGRKFNKKRFKKWVSNNYSYIMRKDKRINPANIITLEQQNN